MPFFHLLRKRSIRWIIVIQLLFVIYINFSICDFKRFIDFNGIKGDKGRKDFSKAVKAVKYKLDQNLHTLTSPSSISPEEIERRQAKVRAAYLKAWKAYEKYAYGHDELLPISKSSKDWLDMALSIVDSIDTMYLMGLTEEYEQARNWIAKHLDFSKNKERVSVFETTIRALGGLVSIYELTKDEMFLDKAVQLGNKLSPVFDSPTGIPYKYMDMKTNEPGNGGCGSSTLVAAGSVQLEFAALSEDSGVPSFGEKALGIFEVLSKVPKFDGLYPIFIDPETGTFQLTGSWFDAVKGHNAEAYVTIGSGGDSFYEYLVKAWILTGKTNPLYQRMYNQAMEAVIGQLVRFSTPSNLVYVADRYGNNVVTHMHHLACFAGGMFALGAHHNITSDPDFHMKLGKELTYTCHEFYTRQPTQIGPEEVAFGGQRDFYPISPEYILRPETVESYFVLYWITGDPIYQQWGWEAFTAIEKYCSTPNGYSGILDVTKKDVQYDDLQQSFFMAETLKYLYLLFSPRDTLPLEEWVFNTEAHPLRVWGKK